MGQICPITAEEEFGRFCLLLAVEEQEGPLTVVSEVFAESEFGAESVPVEVGEDVPVEVAESVAVC